MRYIKVRFTKGIEGLAYQEIDEMGNITRYVSETGETLTLPDVTECEVVETEGIEEDWTKAPQVIPEVVAEEEKEFIDPVVIEEVKE